MSSDNIFNTCSGCKHYKKGKCYGNERYYGMERYSDDLCIHWKSKNDKFFVKFKNTLNKLLEN